MITGFGRIANFGRFGRARSGTMTEKIETRRVDSRHKPCSSAVVNAIALLTKEANEDIRADIITEDKYKWIVRKLETAARWATRNERWNEVIEIILKVRKTL